jgi:hypothetical protein
MVARAGLDLTAFPRHEIEIRGKRETLAIRTLDSAAELPVASADPVHPIPLDGSSAPSHRRRPVSISAVGPSLRRDDGDSHPDH